MGNVITSTQLRQQQQLSKYYGISYADIVILKKVFITLQGISDFLYEETYNRHRLIIDDDRANMVKKPMAILSMGLPGSGKSTTLAKMFKVNEYVNLDCDNIKKTHPSYNPKNPSILHDWSKKELTVLYNNTVKNSKNLIYDGTGTNIVKYQSIISELKSKGYEVTLLYCRTSLTTSVLRNAMRDRVVPLNIILEKYPIIENCWNVLKNEVDTPICINND